MNTEKDLRPKKEVDPNHNNINTSSSSSRQWSSFKNPRIVRVSRNFGGKDRHSKVSTVRGLRDRRIRLSVPTAIQLYDLQDRLGLNQPSKVVDWLINVTQNDIDKLPPLPIIPPNFPQFHQTLSTSNQDYAKNLGGNVENNQDEGFGGSSSFVAQNFFPLSNQFSVPNMPYNSNYFQFDPPNLSLSQFGGEYNNSFSAQTDQEQSQNNYSQMYLCPSANTIPSINIPHHFPSYYNIPSVENEHLIRQINHLQNNVHQNSLMPATLHLLSSQGNGSGKLQDKDSRN